MRLTELEIFTKGKALGMTDAGAAGYAANAIAESAGNPRNVEDRSGIDDEVYTQGVDNGTYTRFTTDAYGYGLFQYTARPRKQALLDYAQGKGVSIGDADMQFQFSTREMRKDYAFVWNRLTSTDDPYEAGYVMCKFFEVPANTEAESQRRGTMAQAIYQRCKGQSAPITPATPAPRQPEKETMWPPRMLCKGMNGADVTALQALLVAHGYGMTAVNGVFGDSTDKAVRNYQQDHGLAVDGIAGNDTFHSLTYFDKVRR